MFLSIKLNSYDRNIFEILHRNNELSTTEELLHLFDPFWLLAAIVPIKSYPNAEADKSKILSDNKNKSGIYMFKNLINGKQYIGSSQNLKKRFMEYFNINHLLKNNYMAICCALIKYDYSNFAITILEYCEPEKCLIREKHYLDIVIPKYNIAQDPTAPMSGRTHSEKSKIIMSDAKKGKNHPNYGQTLNDETKTKISDALKGKPKPFGSGSPSQQIEVTDITNDTTTSYDSISAAARALNINKRQIFYYFVRNPVKPYKGQYTFKKL